MSDVPPNGEQGKNKDAASNNKFEGTEAQRAAAAAKAISALRAAKSKANVIEKNISNSEIHDPMVRPDTDRVTPLPREVNARENADPALGELVGVKSRLLNKLAASTTALRGRAQALNLDEGKNIASDRMKQVLGTVKNAKKPDLKSLQIAQHKFTEKVANTERRSLIGYGTAALGVVVVGSMLAIGNSDDSNNGPMSSANASESNFINTKTSIDSTDWKSNSLGQMEIITSGNNTDQYFQISAAVRTSPQVAMKEFAIGEIRIDKGTEPASKTLQGWALTRDFDDRCYAQRFSAEADETVLEGYTISELGYKKAVATCEETMVNDRTLRHSKQMYASMVESLEEDLANAAADRAEQSAEKAERDHQRKLKEVEAAAEAGRIAANKQWVKENEARRAQEQKQLNAAAKARNFPRPIAGDPAYDNVRAVFEWSPRDMKSQTINYLEWMMPEVVYYSNKSYYHHYHGHTGLETGTSGKWKAVLDGEDNVSHVRGELGVQFVDGANGCYQETLKVQRPVKFTGIDRYDIVHEFQDTEKNLPYLPAGPFEIYAHSLNINKIKCAMLTEDVASLKNYRRTVKQKAKKLWTVNAQDVADYFWRFSGLGNDMVPLAIYDSEANSNYDLDALSKINENNADYIRDENLEQIRAIIKYRMPSGQCYTTRFRLSRQASREHGGADGTLAFPEVILTHYTAHSGSHNGANINLNKSVDAAKTNCDPYDSDYPTVIAYNPAFPGIDLVKKWPDRPKQN